MTPTNHSGSRPDRLRPSDDEYFTTEELSALLKIPAKTLQWWRTQRTGPKFHRDGRHVRYPKTLVDAWLEERTADAERWMAS